MSEAPTYSARSVFEGLRDTLHQYIEAQYHVWDASLIAERQRLMTSAGTTFQEPRLEATPSYESGRSYERLAIPSAAKNILSLAAKQNIGIYPTPYTHQSDALEAILGRDEEIIVATGTGSGKTETFLMPLLGSLAIEGASRSSSWRLPGVRALLLYPMNALVNDQLARLRRLFGSPPVATALENGRGRRATFGMYTSRTPYAGIPTPALDRDRIGKVIKQLESVPHSFRQLLRDEGKWPAKDLTAFVASQFATGADDSELFSRAEMHRCAPDLLITNYSMLEYMLLRPIERSIFEQTAAWLGSDQANRFFVVLDEAHMYRGSGGAEVAYLLRRLHARLGVPRERVRYILTSASLGSGAEAVQGIKAFSSALTGQLPTRSFSLIVGKPSQWSGARPATAAESNALVAYNFGVLHRMVHEPDAAIAETTTLMQTLGAPVRTMPETMEELRASVWGWLIGFGPAGLVANLITAQPKTLDRIGDQVFPGTAGAERAVESLLALITFAREPDTNRVFAPVRSHLFFRGLPGVFACVNADCASRVPGFSRNLLGRVFASPMRQCDCGSRVYELLTHRDCGAAFIRGYVSNKQDFLWHERSVGLWSTRSLTEAHFLVETDRRSQLSTGKVEGSATWLHIPTGRLIPRAPPPNEENAYIQLLRPDGLIVDGKNTLLSFDKECPVCVRKWQGRSKIMDLTTKGEAPFAQLIKTQIDLQPSTRSITDQAPNEGRKSLIFSDGRQKAAKLARDIPREVEQDAFRQILLRATQELQSAGREPDLGRNIYTAFVHVLSLLGLQFFDKDRHTIQGHIRDYKKWHRGDLLEALEESEFTAPPSFTALLLKQIGSRFYSVQALSLAHLHPTKKYFRAAHEEDASIVPDVLRPLIIVWMQEFAEAFAFDKAIAAGIRIRAAGYPLQCVGLAPDAGFTKRQRELIEAHGISVEVLSKRLATTFCEEKEAGSWLLAPKRVRLELKLDTPWFQCLACTALSPVALWMQCPNCLSRDILSVDPEQNTYLRARKGFWRDPVSRVLRGLSRPINLTVEEHTAQLSHRDTEAPTATTEEFERRFRDILITPDETAVDVLSSTTTMEVGIDIGSLVAVALRNVPPLRQNYQQRAGRAGRRGASVSTVLTYAQNSPHDDHYFRNPDLIIAGEPTPPFVDTSNSKIIERHVFAQLVQAFFVAAGQTATDPNIFTLLGSTLDFYAERGPTTLRAFTDWLENSSVAEACYRSISSWLPDGFTKLPKAIGYEMLAKLAEVRPPTPEDIDPSDDQLIVFLFSRGLLPGYAFPRDLCALQIEAGRTEFVPRILQRPQQGLNVALSEYAPGRIVVVDKRSYRIGSVTAGSTSNVVDRAAKLFSERRTYVHCDVCDYTRGFVGPTIATGETNCPVCSGGTLRGTTVIRPQVVYPDGGSEVDEYDEEQVYTHATSAQLPLPDGESGLEWGPFLEHVQFAVGRNTSLVVVNKGELNDGEPDGFLICSKCGKAAKNDKQTAAHKRDYQIARRAGSPSVSPQCTGTFEPVFLGYSFASDVLLVRIPIATPFRCEPSVQRTALPLIDALQSLSEALVLAVSRELGVDHRELNGGHRFVRLGTSYSADVFLYDTLSGGAGYAIEAGKVLSSVFTRAETLLRECGCTSSCDRCLRHYGNRVHHTALNRFLALNLIDFVKTGRAPQLLSRRDQQKELAPLADLMSLAGWNVSSEGTSPITVSNGNARFELSCYPSLVEPEAVGFSPGKQRRAFSPYELSKDLPGAYGELA